MVYRKSAEPENVSVSDIVQQVKNTYTNLEEKFRTNSYPRTKVFGFPSLEWNGKVLFVGNDYWTYIPDIDLCKCIYKLKKLNTKASKAFERRQKIYSEIDKEILKIKEKEGEVLRRKLEKAAIAAKNILDKGLR